MKKIFKHSLFLLILLFGTVQAEQHSCMSDNILCPAPPLVAVAPVAPSAPAVKTPFCKPQPTYHSPVKSLPYFDNIEIKGDMDIIMQVDHKRPQLQASGYLSILRNLHAHNLLN